MAPDLLTSAPRRDTAQPTTAHRLAVRAILAAATAGALAVTGGTESWASFVPALSATGAPEPGVQAVPATGQSGPEPIRVPRRGLRLVGVDIAPGSYRVKCQARCSWIRLSGVDGRPKDVVAAREFSGPATVHVLRSDAAVLSSGCDQLRRVASAEHDRISSTELRRAQKRLVAPAPSSSATQPAGSTGQ